MSVDLSQLLAGAREGDRGAFNRLVALVYQELRELAHRQLARQPAGSLDTTALVNEAYVKLVDQGGAGWQDRTHFLAVAATAMRHLVIDHARRRVAKKRGGEVQHTPLDEAIVEKMSESSRLVALDDALEALERLQPRLARLVELRYFGGLTIAETAGVLEVSEPTVKREWRKARALLFRMLQDEAVAG